MPRGRPKARARPPTNRPRRDRQRPWLRSNQVTPSDRVAKPWAPSVIGAAALAIRGTFRGWPGFAAHDIPRSLRAPRVEQPVSIHTGKDVPPLPRQRGIKL